MLGFAADSGSNDSGADRCNYPDSVSLVLRGFVPLADQLRAD